MTVGVIVDWDRHRVPAPVDGVEASLLTTPRVTIGRYDLAAGVSVPEHVHEGDEVGVVLSGEIEVTVAGRPCVVPEGGTFVIPRGVPHSARTAADACRLFECYAPKR